MAQTKSHEKSEIRCDLRPVGLFAFISIHM